MISSFALSAMIVALSVLSALAALLILAALDRSRQTPNALGQATQIEPTIFLFADGTLLDATSPGRALLEKVSAPGTEWEKLASYVTTKIPRFAEVMATIGERGEVNLASETNPEFRLHAEHLGESVRVTLADLSCEGHGVIVDSLSLRAQEDEVSDLREILGAMPFPIWRTNEDGDVIWANEIYLTRASDMSGEEDLVWPLPVLFHGTQAAGTVRRVKYTSAEGGKSHWFDCHVLASPQGLTHFALPADAVVKAEGSLRDFVQTLAKTFAHLSVGLAIFDKNRQLGLFNPALIDLTTLEAEFLSSRPTLFAFLDRLREARILPEPKNYTGWRQQMLDLERAASMGLYEDSWTLPTGQTFRVIGRPHPDGAIAFVFEDISAELSLTRRFRSQIALGQSVIDALEEAVAVFSPSGDLLVVNSAYGDLWGLNPSESLGNLTIQDASRLWLAKTNPTPTWGELRDFINDSDPRVAWEADVTLLDGRLIHCHFRPLAGGTTMASFQTARREKLIVQRARRLRHNCFADNLH